MFSLVLGGYTARPVTPCRIQKQSYATVLLTSRRAAENCQRLAVEALNDDVRQHWLSTMEFWLNRAREAEKDRTKDRAGGNQDATRGYRCCSSQLCLAAED